MLTPLKLRGCHVLVQQRIAGVGLNIAWPYLSSAQKQSFKGQTRKIMLKLLTITDYDRSTPSYVVEDDDPCKHRGIQERERRILFDGQASDDLGLAHNDLNWSNIIVDDDVIVGVVDWEMAGWFGRDRPAKVHRQIRMPDHGTYSHVPGMTEERLADLLYWNDLYDF